MARQYLSGNSPDWEAWDRPWPRLNLDLPTYPFQRQSYWVESAPVAEPQREAAHALLGHRQRSAASSDVVYTGQLGSVRPPHVADHNGSEHIGTSRAAAAAL